MSDSTSRSVSRRDLLKYAAAAPAVIAASLLVPPRAAAAPLGVLLDYAAGVISAADIRAVGRDGAIRYVSDRRPAGTGCSASRSSCPKPATSTRTA